MSWLRDRRKEKGYTQLKLATKAGISRQYYNEIENSKSVPSIAVAKEIAGLLDFDWRNFF